MRARRAEMTDPRDTATPDDMTRLLLRIWKRDGLTPESAHILLDMMDRTQTGKSRIKGLLPQGTDVAHKTGSLGGVARHRVHHAARRCRAHCHFGLHQSIEQTGRSL
jgi:beta-lactamase class A